MSLAATSWALNEAPLEDPTEAAVLFAMADRARDDGTGCWLSVHTMAAKARVSESTVRRCLKRLEGREVIRRGNQALVDHVRPDRRPVVYDLAMPDRRTRLQPRPDERGVNLTGRDGNGVSDKSQRGVKSGGHGVSPVTDKTSANPKDNPGREPARGESADGQVLGCASHRPRRSPSCADCLRVLPPRRETVRPADPARIAAARAALTTTGGHGAQPVR